MMGSLALFLACLFPIQDLPLSPHGFFYQTQTQPAFKGFRLIPPLPTNQPALNVLSALRLLPFALCSQ